MTEDWMIKITPNETRSPVGKIADAEIHFTAGLLADCKLIGFGIWDAARPGGPRLVTMPARQYSCNGGRRSFALLRPLTTLDGINQVRDLILAAYTAWEQEQRAKAGGILGSVPGVATERADPFF